MERKNISRDQRCVQILIDSLVEIGIERIWSATKYCGGERDSQFKIVELTPQWRFVEFASRCGENLCQVSAPRTLDTPKRKTRARRRDRLSAGFGFRSEVPGLLG